LNEGEKSITATHLDVEINTLVDLQHMDDMQLRTAAPREAATLSYFRPDVVSFWMSLMLVF
jgi:hypothetical protein